VRVPRSLLFAAIGAGRAGVGVLDGEMVDDVHLRMADAVLSRAGLRE
jgi:citrate lyase subunit beta/citryl-CoA lyase